MSSISSFTAALSLFGDGRPTECSDSFLRTNASRLPFVAVAGATPFALAVPAIHRPATATGAYINGYQIVADEGVTMAFGKRF